MSRKTAEEVLAARPDDEQGYQDDAGFVVDEVVGVLELPVVRCHTAAKPSPVERVVMLDDDGDMRVHDFVHVRRVRGKIVVGDAWTFGQAGVVRVGELLMKLLLGAFNKGIGKVLR